MIFEEFKKWNNKARKLGKRVRIEKIENDYLYIEKKWILFEDLLKEIKNRNIFICNPVVLKDFKKFKDFSVGTFIYNKKYGIEIEGIILKRLDEMNYLIQYKDDYGNYWTEENNINEL